MTVNRIDHIVVPVASLDTAAAPYEKLGLVVSPATRHAGLGTENRAFFVGGRSNTTYIELLAIHDEQLARQAAPERAEIYLGALARGEGVARLILGSEDLPALVRILEGMGAPARIDSVSREGGAKIADILPLEAVPHLGLKAAAISYVEDRAAQHARRHANGLFAHSFPLKRLDHLAAMVAQLEETTEAWTKLGATVHGEVEGRGMLIRQLRMGDAILELLYRTAPAEGTPTRPPGLASMAAWEVDHLDEVVGLARERGFHPSDPAIGILPGTRVATIPAAELSGVGMQLLEYV